MPTTRSRLSRIGPVALLVFIVSVLVEESDQHILRSSPVESLCLRRCLLRAVKRSKTKVSPFSCKRNCINRNNQDQEALTANVLKPRIRKAALKPIPECGDSSRDQSVDWTPKVVNVTFGQYENTTYWYVNVSWTPLNESCGNWTDIMVRLVVWPPKHDPTAPSPATCFVHPKNLTFLNINISALYYEYPSPILLKVVALPYSTKEDFADIALHDPLTPIRSTISHTTVTPPPTEVNATTIRSTISHTTGVFPTTTARKSTCSKKEYGDLEWYPSNVDGLFLKRSNGDWFANISWTPLTNSTVTWSGYFLSFYFGDVPEDVVNGQTAKCFEVPKNQTSYIVDSSSDGWKPPQSISVSVSAYPFPKETAGLMHYFQFPVDKPPEIPTTSPPKQPEIPTTSPPTSGNDILITTVFSSVGGGFVLVLITLLLVLRCRRIRRKPSPSPTTVAKPLRFKYHAFVIYSSKDHDFVRDILIPTLERYSFKYCIHWKDFPVGEVFAKTIVKSVYNSFKIIAVVSENFATSNPCKFELDHAQHRLLTYRDDCLIVIKYDNVNVTELLGGPLLERSYIDYTSNCDRSWWESRLVQVLQKAVLADESDDCSEGNANNNNLTQGNSSGNSGEELICSCQPAV